MFISKKHLSRRTVLRGMGATVALPFLDAMVPAAVAQRETAASRQDPLRRHRDGARCRRVVGRRPGQELLVAGQGRLRLRLYAQPVAARARSATTSRSSATPTWPTPKRLAAPEVGGDHNRSSSVFLTASHPKRTEGSDIFAGVSMDQIYAQQLRSGHAAAVDPDVHRERRARSPGACGYGYSCVYSTAISWASPTMPLPSERDPRVMFERLFGHGATASERAARRRRRHDHPRRHPPARRAGQGRIWGRATGAG